MIIDFHKSLYWSSVFIQVLPFISSLFNKAFNPQLKALFIYFFISLLNEILSNFPGFFHLKDDLLLLHIYTIFEALLILYIYFKEFEFKNPYPMILMSAAFTCIALLKLSGTEYNDVACS